LAEISEKAHAQETQKTNLEEQVDSQTQSNKEGKKTKKASSPPPPPKK